MKPTTFLWDFADLSRMTDQSVKERKMDRKPTIF